MRVQCYLDRDITIGEPSRSWWQTWRNTIALILFAAALIVGAYVFSGGTALP